MQKINNLLHRNRDANHNGIPDSQERNVYGTNSLNDRNHNGIPDSQERQGPVQKVKNLLHLSRDANHNGIPDSQERNAYGNNSFLPQGIPQQNLGYKRSLHQELMGRNGMWNLKKAQTRSYVPRDYYNMETGFEREWAQSGQSQTFLREAPLNLERVEKEVVVHEHIHPVEKEEIQPVIYREREQLDIKQITQQLHETQIQPTFVQKRELAPEYREAIVERGAPIQENVVLPTVDRDVTMKSQIVKAPIVNETIKKTVIEEIQPVLERDIIQSTLIQETKNIYEKVIEAPTVYRETTVIQDRGISGGSLQNLSAQGFNLGSYQSGFSNDRNMNGIPDNLERNSQFGNDRNMNGIPDNLEGGMRHNPLDRNHDGRVNLQDLKSADRNHNGIPDSQERLGQTGLVGGLNDRNMNGIPDSQERLGQQGLVGGLNDRNHNGIPDSQERLGQGLMGQQRTANPLDRNNDGKVDFKDLTGQPGYNQGLVGQRTANPLDKNNDGKVDFKDLTGQPSQQGLMGQQRTVNPLDRNNDGKVDFKDLTSNKAAPIGAQAPLRTL